MALTDSTDHRELLSNCSGLSVCKEIAIIEILYRSGNKPIRRKRGKSVNELL